MKVMMALSLVLGISILAGCQEKADQGANEVSQQLAQDLETLANARVFFGHQSVGENIIDGLKDLARHNQQQAFPIHDLETMTGDAASKGLIHTPVGENTKPVTKCVDFERIIDQDLSGKVDFALLKFCYIDINRDSDVTALFQDYQRIIDGLIQRHPEVTFVHTTVPLRHSPGGFGVWIRELLGRENVSKLDNIKRNEFNQLLYDTYNENRLIDIARYESTYADGQRESFTEGGKTYYGLIGDYTSDGGHLNDSGRQWVAQSFVQDLAKIIRTQAPQ
jgi:hypothetical protein